MMRPGRHRHLLGIEGLSAQDVIQLLDSAEVFYEVSRRPVRKVPTLRGKTLVNLFFEPSTRTRSSFELAAKRLSADLINVNASSSSVVKGETLLDTCKTLEAMHPDVVVMRHGSSGAPHFIAKHLSCSIVNAGDGLHEHPTQALLDAFTIRRHKGKLQGLKVAICGDIRHSRVARSNALLLSLFGCELRFVAPRTLLPDDHSAFDAQHVDNLREGLDGVDVVMALRLQRERMKGAFIPSLREYARNFGIGKKELAWAKEDAVVMHPGPINRGVELAPDVADGARSVVLEQVEAGVAIRMAVLYQLAAELGQAPGG